MLNNLKKACPEGVEKLIPDVLPLEAVVAVIQKLLEEQVPVYDLPTILEALTKRAPVTGDKRFGQTDAICPTALG
jgi:flagellar biosynthesis protein FlhA